jgi:outer membrane lipoprotein-sorting protein
MRIVTSFLLALVCLHGDTLSEIIARMDADAPAFRGVTAQLNRIEYTAAIKDTTVYKGEVTLLKQKRGVAALLTYASPDPRQLQFKEGTALEYLPNTNTINEYDIGKFSSVVNEFVTLGFGTSGQDLKKSYSVTLIGPETLNDTKVTKLELVPRKPEALQYMKKIEMWVLDGKSYAVQLKIYQPSGDWDTATYSSVQINPPGLNEHSIDLKTKKNPKREKINK